ncbi:hypothetical protein RQP46_006102 [Phenoliferia psychrophenolica]
MGLAVRCYQLALMKRNIFENLGGHAISMTAFGGLGYYLYNTDIRQRAILAEKKDQLLRMREREAALAGAGGDHDGHH